MTNRQQAVEDAATVIAEYICAWGRTSDLLSDIESEVELQLTQIRNEAAKERALDEKADRLGMRY